MTNNLSSSNLLLIILSSFLLIIIAVCGVLIIFLRLKKEKLNNKHKILTTDSENLELLHEIKKYQNLRNKYKTKLKKHNYLNDEYALNEMKQILDAELLEYKKDRLLAIANEIEKDKSVLLRNVLLNVMQPLHLKIINEASIHFIPIDEKYKPLLIGKKGRNIKLLSDISGCNISIRQDKNYVEISCPNPYYKQLAINTINHLLKSEAFDANAISNVFNKESKLLQKECIDVGKQYLNKLNINYSGKDLYEYVGRLKYRWSYGQNALEHCYETAIICQNLALELGLDGQIAKEVGFFHDIGKSVDYENKYDHINIGIQIAKQCNLPQYIVEAIAKHHRTNCYDDYVLLLRCADAWSAARIGSRHVPDSNNDSLTQIVKSKLNKVKGISSYRVEINDKNINIIFVPKNKNIKYYLDKKHEIIHLIKKDIRLNKYYIKIVD